MNKIKTISIFLISIISLSFFSCKNDTEILKKDCAYISVSANFSNARSIVPSAEDFSVGKLNNITLSGLWNNEETRTILEKDNWEGFFGDCPIAIQTGTWDFTLSAYLNGVEYSGTISEKEIAVTSDSSPIGLDFELSPEAGSKGGISIQFNIISGDAATGLVTLSQSGTNVDTQTITIVSNSITYAKEVQPGDYDLTVAFQNANSEVLSTWEGMVRVLAGVTTTAEIDWALNSIYTISYEYNGGSLVDASFICAETYTSKGGAVALPELEKTDFLFDGWYEDEDFSGDKLTEIAAGSSGNKTLYAHFIPKFAKVGETLYTNLSDTLTAITGASGEITIELYSPVTENDIGIPEGTSYAPDIEGTIAYAIKNTSASAVNLVVAEDAGIAVSDLSYLFKGCSKLKTADLRGIDTSSATSLFGLFYNCSALTSFDISTFDFSNITNVAFMFNGCSSLTEIDCSNFDTSRCNNMHGMFYGCSSLTSLDVSSFDTGKADSYVNMFTNCSSLVSLDISSFTTTRTWNGTTEIKQLGYMFTGCSSLVYINVASTFDLSSFTMDSGDNMFSGCTELLGDNGTTFDSTKIQAEYARPDGGTDSPGYFRTYRIGYKNRPTEVGDIVFNDGSALPYTDGMTFTEAQKEAAIAVIFYKGRDLVEDGVISGQDFELGVGLVQSSNLPWCTEDAKGYSTNFEGMHCTISGSAGNYTIEGDRSGRNNTMVMEGALGSNDDTGTAGNYPAFEFAANYKDQPGVHLTVVYLTGWYLPSIAEMYTIYQNREMVNGALAALDATQLNSTADNCWSSNQCPDSATAAYGFNFSNGEIGTFSKNNNRNGVEYACAIFQF